MNFGSNQVVVRVGVRGTMINPGNGISVAAVLRNASVRDTVAVEDYCVGVRSALRNGRGVFI